MSNQAPTDNNPVNVERHEGWATVLLNRPFRRNALTGPMVDALADAVEELGQDQSVSAIVLRGSSGSCCSGVDLKELQAKPQHSWVPGFSQSNRRLHLALFHCPIPVVGALEGYGINAGTALALACDLIIAGKTSFLQIGEIHQGAAIPMNAAWMRLKLSESVLARMALYGDRIEAPRLAELGVVHEVVGDDDVRSVAEDRAAKLASHPAGSSRTIKAAIVAQRHLDAETWFQHLGPNNALLNAKQVRS